MRDLLPAFSGNLKIIFEKVSIFCHSSVATLEYLEAGKYSPSLLLHSILIDPNREQSFQIFCLPQSINSSRAKIFKDGAKYLE